MGTRGLKVVSLEDNAPLKALYKIAAREGNPLVIDTLSEKDDYIRTFDPDGALLTLYYTLTNVPNYMVNPFYRGEANGTKYGDLVPLPNNAAIGFFVFVGGFGFGRVPSNVFFVSIDGGKWDKIIKPLTVPPPGPNEERERLKEVVHSIEIVLERIVGVRVGGDYVDSMARNCFDKSAGVMQSLLALQYMGLMRFHQVNPSRRYFERGLVHRSARVTEIESGTSFMIDTWADNGEGLVLPENLWGVYVNATFNTYSTH